MSAPSGGTKYSSRSRVKIISELSIVPGVVSLCPVTYCSQRLYQVWERMYHVSPATRSALLSSVNLLYSGVSDLVLESWVSSVGESGSVSTLELSGLSVFSSVTPSILSSVFDASAYPSAVLYFSSETSAVLSVSLEAESPSGSTSTIVGMSFESASITGFSFTVSLVSFALLSITGAGVSV